MKPYFKSLSDQLINQPQDGKTLVERYASSQSDFCQAVVTAGYLSQQQMEHAALQYHLGKSTTGGVIFWEIDEEQRIRDGKVMTYLSNCHRNKEKPPTWVSFLLKKQNAIPHVFDAKQCLFGQHLLPKEESSIIAVVEAEKTAVICSELFPEYCWMATGGQSMLNVAKLYPLREHRVVLFPDTDETGQTYTQWKDVTLAAQDMFHYPIRVSRVLEEHASADQKRRKIDIVDFLFDGYAS